MLIILGEQFLLVTLLHLLKANDLSSGYITMSLRYGKVPHTCMFPTAVDVCGWNPSLIGCSDVGRNYRCPTHFLNRSRSPSSKSLSVAPLSRQRTSPSRSRRQARLGSVMFRQNKQRRPKLMSANAAAPRGDYEANRELVYLKDQY